MSVFPETPLPRSKVKNVAVNFKNTYNKATDHSYTGLRTMRLC